MLMILTIIVCSKYKINVKLNLWCNSKQTIMVFELN